MAIKFDIKTGLVFIRNYDQGIVETMGGYVDIANGGTRRNYFLDVPGVSPPQVPIIFNKPKQIYENKTYPSILITRGDVSPDLVRWHSVCALQYRCGVPGTEASVILDNGDVVSGYEEYESLVQAFLSRYHTP